jgi:hypothetical protein
MLYQNSDGAMYGRTTVRPIGRMGMRRPRIDFATGAMTECDDHEIHFVVARSSLRAITFVFARCASLRLTSIAPTHAAIASVAMSSLRAIPFDDHILNRLDCCRYEIPTLET